GQSQNRNKEITEAGSKPYLLGKIDKQGLTSENYVSWFTTGFDEYQPNPQAIKEISKELKEYHILLFMGTWCGDSRREVPHFYKVLEAANYPMKQLTTIAVSRNADLYKQSPGHEEKGLNIHRVPTFIFYKDGREVNRIVEHPVKSLEEDIVHILQGKYTSNYYLVTKVNELIEEESFYELAHHKLNEYKKLATNWYELNTYSKILETNQRKEKALAVLKLNTHLFPEQSGVYVSLGNFQLKSGQKMEAISTYEKALELNQKNVKLKNTIDQLKSELSGSGN
ncbi:MAG: thioredoxin family protein, partial [Flavobacteriaceae bacterium]|nr:thioredoxin family protein [Flavobacteriaceae bacterium]